MYLYHVPRIMCDVLYFILFMRMHIGRYVFHLCTRSQTVKVVEKALLIPHTYTVNSVCINIDICTQYNFKLYLNRYLRVLLLYLLRGTRVRHYNVYNVAGII